MKKTRIAILGAGPAGLGAAWQLAKQRKAEVTVLEQQAVVGGNAGSFEIDGLRVDYGSHRLHPACDPQILADLRELLGDDLLDRPRHGRIRLQGSWIHFPLKAQDLLFRLPPAFGSGVAMDGLKKLTRRNGNGNGNETFTSVLEKGLGTTICRDFYFPYAEKIWGLPPSELSATQAHRRVSAGSMSKMIRKIVSVVPGFKAPGAGRFFYPRKGYGQISEAIAVDAERLGANIKLNSSVREVVLGERKSVTFEREGALQTIEADHIWSTIPLTILAGMVSPKAPSEVLEASRRISYRSMVLIYLVLETEQWTPYDAHYFPEANIKLTRLSEPKNYSDSKEPAGRTVLCGELPCTVGDEIWRATDEELGEMVRDSLDRCGLPIRVPVSKVITKRLPFAYPIYRQGYEEPFELQDRWTDGLEGVLTFGRQGLFAHDNTHHALAMAYGAVDCLDDSGNFDHNKWRRYRKEFAKHVVED
jgi:protoporphyrinogen oxidase